MKPSVLFALQSRFYSQMQEFDYREIYQYYTNRKKLEIHLDNTKPMFILALIKFYWNVLSTLLSVFQVSCKVRDLIYS